MEKEQQDRLKVIAKRAILAAGALGLYTYRDEILGHARSYPAGSYIVEIVNDVREKSIRLTGRILSRDENNLELDVDKDSEISEKDESELDDQFSPERIAESKTI